MATYDNRLVLFIDFLAFRELVDQTADDETLLDHLLSALSDLREVGMEPELFPSQQMTHFSDSVVLSFKIEEQSAVFWMLTQIGLAIFTLAGSGYLVRGAVTVGKLYHTAEALVGPAMITAYEMESKQAIYPRVIIDPAVIDIAREYRSEIHHADEEEKYVRSGLATAPDGQLWIDYVSYRAYVDAGAEPDGYPAYLERIGELIRNGLAHQNVSVVRKYAWLHPLYLSQIELFSGIPIQETEEAEAQRLHVAHLPKLLGEMEIAQARISQQNKPWWAKILALDLGARRKSAQTIP